VDEKLGGLRKEPLHDHYSHAADAFRTAAVMIRDGEEERAGEAQAGIQAVPVELIFL
jgi:hypothetical protein